MPRLSFTQPADFLKERDFGQKLEATFDFVRTHFRPLGKCLLYIVLPITLLNGVARGLLQERLTNYFRQIFSARGDKGLILSSVSDFLSSPQYAVVAITGLITLAFLILTVYSYMILRLRASDATDEIPVSAVWQMVKKRLLGTILAFFGLTIGLLALLLPFFVLLGLIGASVGSAALVLVLMPVLYCAMLYAAIALSLFFIIWVREELGFFATVRRCFYLIWGKWWSTFGLIMIILLIITFITFILALPTGIINASSFIIPNAVTTNPILLVAANSLSAIFMTLLYPLLFIALAFQYFNLVERKDGEGLRTLVDRLGQPAAAHPTRPDSDYYRPEEEGDY